MMNNQHTQNKKPNHVVLQVTLQDHLKRLEVAEFSKPSHQRRKIPNVPELARITGITRQSMYNLAANRIDRVSLKTLSVVMSELRRRGFPTEVSDLLTAYPANPSAES